MLLTARLDGPSPAIAKRLVDDAIEAEAVGLKGKAYIDARGIKYDPKNATPGDRLRGLRRVVPRGGGAARSGRAAT